MPTLDAIPTWQAADPDALADHTVVVLDVLRWTTVVTTALAHGAVAVEACATPDDARRRAHALGRDRVLLGGERENVRLPGFDAGNSPAEYTRARVEGRVIVTSTTNGTQALLAASRARRIVLGCFRNLGALVHDLAARPPAGPTTLLCAGRSGQEAEEDTACAGAIADALRELAPGLGLTPAAERARAVWRAADGDPARAIRDVAHARALRADGFGDDVTFACAVSVVSVVPVAVGARLVRVPTA